MTTALLVRDSENGEYAYTYFGDLKDDVLKEMPWGGFEIFMDECSPCEFCKYGLYF